MVCDTFCLCPLYVKLRNGKHSVGLNDQQRMEQPNAGAVFAIRLEGIKGVPEPYFQG